MTTSTLMPLPPYPGLRIGDVVDRHSATGGDVRNAVALVNKALDAAFEADEDFVRINRARGLNREQFTQVVCHCFYNTLFETALIAKSLWLVANDMHVYTGQIGR
ncbi:hypothetical protein [Streptomyces rhizosphaerihabitans]|uniref:hypothetical protein n=1 Tax=Streptomyces rhizosphaerihabitans TaxID=1266770 RepID=UPI0021BE2D92|nr:hypothetical protein [Streptomyces rhizosphaerihabitans]MCT9003500.1 hypothetical protein [Streptomyces rhizosphaerihabitans]